MMLWIVLWLVLWGYVAFVALTNGHWFVFLLVVVFILVSAWLGGITWDGFSGWSSRLADALCMCQVRD